MPKYIISAVLILGILFIVFNGRTGKSFPSPSVDNKESPVPTVKEEVKGMKQYNSYPAMIVDTNKEYIADLKTSKGDIKIKLFTKDVPKTVNNFVFLIKEGFYNGTRFHRIIKGFMIQGGDPEGNGTGGPGYKFEDEKVTRDYKRGIVAMANSGPDTNGSQFFIMHEDRDLPKNYTIFGEVTEGLDTLDKIADSPVTGSQFGEMSSPTEEIKIIEAKIEE